VFVEERTYTLKPGTVADYLSAYARDGLEVQREHLGNLIGYFTTEIGTLNQIVHMWGYESMAERQQRRTALYSDPRWQEYLPTVLPWLVRQESRILLPTSFSPIGLGS
jgi:NIPSNAP